MKKQYAKREKEVSSLQDQGRISTQKKSKGALQTKADNSPQVQRAAQLQSMADSSPQVQQATQLQAIADHHTNSKDKAPAQLKISYKRGQFKSREELVAGLCTIFPEEAYGKIEEYVDAYEADSGRAMFGSQVYKFIVEALKGEGFLPTYATTTEVNQSEHGPMLPDKVNRDDQVADPEGAMGAFNYPQVTLGRMTLMDGRTKISFQDRNAEGHVHAEDRLLEQLMAFIRLNQIDTRTLKLNLTINNFFCSEHNTKKRDKSHNCLDEMIELQRRLQFARFHVYFKNPYGKPEEMADSIAKLKNVDILVSSFTTTDAPPYANPMLDPHSDDEEDTP